MNMAQVQQKRIHESKTVWGAAIMLVVFVAQQYGYEIGEGEISALIESAIAFVGAALVVYGRFTAKKKVVWKAK
jgi:hypothetical protein